MIEIPDSLHSLFSATVEQRDGSYVIEVPSEEVTQGTITPGESYRIAVFAQTTSTTRSTDSRSTQPRATRTETTNQEQGPPVDEGEVRDVSIETLGSRATASRKSSAAAW